MHKITLIEIWLFNWWRNIINANYKTDDQAFKPYHIWESVSFRKSYRVQGEQLMSDIISFESLEGRFLQLRDTSVLIDRDVAELFGVETRNINLALKNNPNKFPDGYIIQLTKDEKKELLEKFPRFNKLKYSPVPPKAFSEKGLYMIATILKGDIAAKATVEIIEAFSKLK